MGKTSDILKQIKECNWIELGVIKNYLNHCLKTMNINFNSINESVKQQKGLVCPHCQSSSFVKTGTYLNKSNIRSQRFKCKKCGITFNYKTNTIVHGAKLDFNKIELYVDCFLSGISIRRCASACGICKDTALLWRHKILDALTNRMEDILLDGIVEADETLFNISYKGNHTLSVTGFSLPREAHKNGKSIHKRGQSREKICVPCAVNRNGLSYAKISNTGRVSTGHLHSVFDGKIKKGSVLVADSHNAYVNFATNNGFNLVQIKGGRGKQGIYHIQHINSYHSRLKKFVEKFNGVSTKYLNNYIVWNNFINYSNFNTDELKNEIFNFAFTTSKTCKRRTMSLRPNLPVLPKKVVNTKSINTKALAQQALNAQNNSLTTR